MNIRSPILPMVLACALAVNGCATSYPAADQRFSLPPPRADTIGRLAVDGPNAYINGARAPHGSYVREGDTVSTGAATSANLVLNVGGAIQLAENTDPEFRLFRQGACVLMSIFRGQAAVATSGTCIEFRNERLNTAGVAHSLVNIDVIGAEARVTVIEGQVDMVRPGATRLGRYDQYIAAADGTWSVRPLTAADAAATAAWTRRYFGAAAADKSGLSAPWVLAIGAAIGVLLGSQHGGQATSPPTRTAPAGPTGVTVPARGN